MSEYTYGALTNLGICGAVATEVVVTSSPGPLIGLILIVTAKWGQKKGN